MTILEDLKEISLKLSLELRLLSGHSQDCRTEKDAIQAIEVRSTVG